MQGDVSDIGSGGAAGFEDFRRKVEAGCGCGGGAAMFGEDGLITVFVGIRGGWMNVGRQRCFADLFEQRGYGPGGGEADGAFSVFAVFEDLAGEFGREENLVTGAGALAGTHEAAPLTFIGV